MFIYFKVFHPFGIAVASNKDSRAYSFVFNFLKDCELLPKQVLSEDSAAIKAAFSSVWPEAEQLDCWFHVKK